MPFPVHETPTPGPNGPSRSLESFRRSSVDKVARDDALVVVMDLSGIEHYSIRREAPEHALRVIGFRRKFGDGYPTDCYRPDAPSDIGFRLRQAVDPHRTTAPYGAGDLATRLPHHPRERTMIPVASS